MSKELSAKQNSEMQEIEIVFDALSQSLTDLLEMRDGLTGGHSKRVTEYAYILACALMERGFSPKIDEDFLRDLRRSSVIHDIGKVGIRDSVLKGKKRFSKENDSEIIEHLHLHTTFGAEVLDRAIQTVGHKTFLDFAREVCLYHHEKWDGSGYPSGLKGEEIPLSARIVAVADVYDALTSARTYKAPLSHDETLKIMLEDSGRAFQPEIIKVFAEEEKKIEEALIGFEAERLKAVLMSREELL